MVTSLAHNSRDFQRNYMRGYRTRKAKYRRKLDLLFSPFEKELTCPNCGFKWNYDGSNPLCEHCQRGLYAEPHRFFSQFPIKPIKNWIIMPICEFCNRPSTRYDDSIKKFVCGNPAHYITL